LATELIDEDDENIELWYLVGVASLSIHPCPDYESARYYLEHAKEMIGAMMEMDRVDGNVSDSDDGTVTYVIMFIESMSSCRVRNQCMRGSMS